MWFCRCGVLDGCVVRLWVLYVFDVCVRFHLCVDLMIYNSVFQMWVCLCL